MENPRNLEAQADFYMQETHRWKAALAKEEREHAKTRLCLMGREKQLEQAHQKILELMRDRSNP